MADRAKPLEYAPSGELYRGSLIRSLRQAKGWTLTELGQRLGCQLSLLSNIETNRVAPAARLLESIATELAISLAELEQAPLPPLLAAKHTGRTSPHRPPRPFMAADHGHMPPVRRAPATNGHIATTAPGSWSFGDQVEAIIASFQLSPNQQQLAHALITDLTRSLCLHLKAPGMSTTAVSVRAAAE